MLSPSISLSIRLYFLAPSVSLEISAALSFSLFPISIFIPTYHISAADSGWKRFVMLRNCKHHRKQFSYRFTSFHKMFACLGCCCSSSSFFHFRAFLSRKLLLIGLWTSKVYRIFFLVISINLTKYFIGSERFFRYSASGGS